MTVVHSFLHDHAPVGAEVREDGVRFRVWATRARRVEVVLEDDGDRGVELAREGASGYFSGLVKGVRPGARYRYRLDGAKTLLPDPASRFQPEGPHGPSRVETATRFLWTDDRWRGVDAHPQVVYEMHVGTFTPEGTWAAAEARLPDLVDIGVTMIEMMPVADFPGTFGWGYDGVDLYAPTRLYGEPDALRRFVDRAHALGVAVILDVVYNHLGPDGNYLAEFSSSYFTDRYTTDWGAGINFVGEDAAPVREFFAENAAYWIRDFHFDGLRLDATQNVYDHGDGEHVLALVCRKAREAAGDRPIFVVAENEPQERRLVMAPERGGFGFDAVWNDDFHHSALVALTGRREAYYMDYRGEPQEFVSAAKHGYLFQGQVYSWQNKRRGSESAACAPSCFVTFLENHDQVANTIAGERLHRLASPSLVRALTAFSILMPGTPMLFQGQEFASSAPFSFFADHGGELGRMVREGRGTFLRQFPSLAGDEAGRRFADPGARATFERSKLDWSERARHEATVAFHRDMIALKRGDPVFSGKARRAIDGAVLGRDAFVLRYAGVAPAGDRLIVVNLGVDEPARSFAEPLLAPPEGTRWTVLASTEDPRYGGRGTLPWDTDRGFALTAQCALALAPTPATPATVGARS